MCAMLRLSLFEKMSHFSNGSEKPAVKGDNPRLYSMRFCPFAQVILCSISSFRAIFIRVIIVSILDDEYSV